MNSIEFKNVCPFLTCTITTPHSHPVCPDCDTVNFANFGCRTCVEKNEKISDEFRKLLLDALD